MTVRAVGNKAPVFGYGQPQLHGIGAASRMVGLGLISLIGKAGEKTYVTAQEVFAKGLQFGTYVQTTGGATLDFTLQRPEIAMAASPDIQAGIAWSNTITASRDITEIPILFSVIRITFTADGELYIVSR